MGLLLATATGLVVWVVLWAVGVKGIDAFFITLAIVISAATARIISPFLPGNRPR